MVNRTAWSDRDGPIRPLPSASELSGQPASIGKSSGISDDEGVSAGVFSSAKTSIAATVSATSSAVRSTPSATSVSDGSSPSRFASWASTIRFQG